MKRQNTLYLHGRDINYTYIGNSTQHHAVAVIQIAQRNVTTQCFSEGATLNTISETDYTDCTDISSTKMPLLKWLYNVRLYLALNLIISTTHALSMTENRAECHVAY